MSDTTTTTVRNALAVALLAASAACASDVATGDGGAPDAARDARAEASANDITDVAIDRALAPDVGAPDAPLDAAPGDDAPSLDAPPPDTPAPLDVADDAPRVDDAAPEASAPDGASPDAAPDGGRDPELIGAGDIAGPLIYNASATAAIIERYPTATVFTTGDNAYLDGSMLDFTLWYAPTWGRFLARTRPTAGNHEYNTREANGYFSYFGARAGARGQGWYSYDLGAWHLVALNTNCGDVGGCDAASPQGRWLAADLAATRARCVLAYFHHPRFSSGRHGDVAAVQPVWQALYDNGADVVLAGHDHSYERFAPQSGSGAADPARGIREFVVGSGGAPFYAFARVAPNSEFRNATEHGVLRLVLHAASYEWEWITPGGVRDRGTGDCH